MARLDLRTRTSHAMLAVREENLMETCGRFWWRDVRQDERLGYRIRACQRLPRALRGARWGRTKEHTGIVLSNLVKSRHFGK